MIKLPPTRTGVQAGFVLLEGLIAILIFSMGILAIVGMQAVAAKEVADAKYRSEACLLANELIGTMWVDGRTVAALQASYSTTPGPGGAGYTAWQAKVVANLPGTTPYPPTVSISANGTVTVTIKWHLPGTAVTSPHKYVTVAQIGG